MTKWITGWAFLALLLAGCDSEVGPAADDMTDNGPPTAGAITHERLLAAEGDPDNWLTTGRDFGKTHYSPLADINRDNADRLGVAWDYATATNRGLEATPIVVDGMMYTSGPWGIVFALDAATGDEIWYFDSQSDKQAARFACCGTVNRGVAVHDGKVFVASLEGHLFALDAADGSKLWEVDTIDDKSRAYTVTGAPEVAGDVVVIGNSGAEFDARGYITAYDTETGAEAWRFYTVPRDPALGQEHEELDMALETWDPESRWDVGGGGTVWDALVYDPGLNLLYVGTGNSALYNQAERSPSGGDNLFLSSILAINPDTGRLVWHYQTTPGDSWDFTATQPIILADMEWRGEERKLLMQAPKNGFFYVLDRETGELLSADPFAFTNWASHVDLETGRPVINEAVADYDKGVRLIYPSPGGAHNWHPMAYSPDTGLVYIPTTEMGMYTADPTEGHDYVPKSRNVGVRGLLTSNLSFGGPFEPEDQKVVDSGTLLAHAPGGEPVAKSMLKAFDPRTGETRWELEGAGWWDRSGVLATGGGLIFQGTATGLFRAIDAETGDVLKEIDIGTGIVAAPMTYRVDGVQYVAVMAANGGVPLSFAPPPESAAAIYGNDGRILSFRLDGKPAVKPAPIPQQPLPEPPPLEAGADTVNAGAQLFGGMCAPCHQQLAGSEAPDLRRMTPAIHAEFDDILLKGTRRGRGMPQWDDLLNKEDADAIHAYIISFSWDDYRAQQENKDDHSK